VPQEKFFFFCIFRFILKREERERERERGREKGKGCEKNKFLCWCS
jgi:hypothetical protein